MATVKKSVTAKPAGASIPGVLEARANDPENIKSAIEFAIATGQGDKIGQEAWDMLPNVPRPLGMDKPNGLKPTGPGSDDVLIIEVRDVHGNLLFKYNDRSGCIEFLQKSKPDGRGGKFPPMLYLIPIQELMLLGRHNLFSSKPTKVMPVNGVVVNDDEAKPI